MFSTNLCVFVCFLFAFLFGEGGRGGRVGGENCFFFSKHLVVLPECLVCKTS